ncbi:hypothetical protein JXC34_03850 [Candidatus Woesearchaeota archaeon]|nr:hypothetical protein [Candidatus Woesearchaeota archaeon]
MIACRLVFTENVEELHKIFLSEKLNSDRAECRIEKGKTLVFEINAKDPVSMKAFMNSILNIVQTYEKVKNG